MRFSRLFFRAAIAAAVVPLCFQAALRAEESAVAPAAYPGDAQAQALRQSVEANLALAPTREVFDEMMTKLSAALAAEAETSGHPMLWGLRGKMFLMLRNGPLALADFTKALELDPTHPEVVAWASEYYLAVGQVADAEARVKPALEKHPANIFLLNANLGILTLKQDWVALEPAAAAMIPLAQALTDANQRIDGLSVAYARLAQAQAFQGRFAEAAESYRLSLAQRDNPDVRFAYAECLEKTERFLDAQNEYNRILSSLPQNAQTEIPRQRLAGKIAMVEPKAAEDRARRDAELALDASQRKASEIAAAARSGSYSLYDFDDANNYWAGMDDYSVPSDWVLSALSATERDALHAALDELAAGWKPSPMQEAVEAWLLDPTDAKARAKTLELLAGGSGVVHSGRIRDLMPERVWTRVPEPADKDFSPEGIFAPRKRAMELWDKLRADSQPADSSALRNVSGIFRSYDPTVFAWFASVEALRPKIEEIVALHPLPNALCALSLLDLVAGNEQASRENAALAAVVYQYNVDQRYMGGAEHSGAGVNWLPESFADSLWNLDPSKETEQRKQGRALAVRILKAIPSRDWDTIAAALEELRSSLIAEAGYVEVTAAAQLALAVEADGIVARRFAQPVSDLIDAGAAPDAARAEIAKLSRFIGAADPRVSWLEAKLLAKEEKPAESLAKLKAALGADPLMREALAARAALLEADGDTRGAMLHYNAAAGCRPTAELAPRLAVYGQQRDRLEAVFGAERFKQYAEGFNALFRSNEAETYGVQLMSMERLRQLNTTAREYHMFTAYVKERMKRDDEAIASWKSYIEAEGADKNVGFEAIGARYWHRKDYAASADWYGKAIENGSQNPDAYHWRGSARVEIEQFDAALADLDEAVKRGGTRPWTQRLRGRVLASQGKADLMKTAYEEARRLAYAQNNATLATEIDTEFAEKRAALETK